MRAQDSFLINLLIILTIVTNIDCIKPRSSRRLFLYDKVLYLENHFWIENNCTRIANAFVVQRAEVYNGGILEPMSSRPRYAKAELDHEREIAYIPISDINLIILRCPISSFTQMITTRVTIDAKR